MKFSYRDELAKLIKELGKDQIIDYCEMMVKNWWNLQNNWMLNISKDYGSEIAAKYDAAVFGRQAEVQAYRLKKMFNLSDDMPSFIKAMCLSTLFANVDYEITEITDKHCRLSVTSCSMQLNRRKVGLPELPCKIAGIEANGRFARAMNPKFKMVCALCPPDKHTDDLWCEWIFDLSD